MIEIKTTHRTLLHYFKECLPNRGVIKMDPRRDPNDARRNVLDKGRVKSILKGLLCDHTSKRNQGKPAFERQISKIVNNADKNKDNEISLPEFLDLMKDVVSTYSVHKFSL